MYGDQPASNYQASLVPEHAVAAGAVADRPVSGDALRNGKLVDPFGHRWMAMTRKAQS